jgi:hypothetical protein
VQDREEERLQHAADLAAAEAAYAEAAGEWNRQRTKLCDAKDLLNEQYEKVQCSLEQLQSDADKAKVWSEICLRCVFAP